MPLPDWALTDITTAREYLRRKDASDDARIMEAVIGASVLIEWRLGRRAKSRTYAAGTPDTRLRLDGTGNVRIRIPHWPLTAFTAAWYLDEFNTERALDITYARVDPAGIVMLQRDVFYKGEANILVSCTAGYVAGVHDRELSALSKACLRLTQVQFQDWENVVGRAESVSGGGQTVTLSQSSIPPDVEQLLLPMMALQ